MNITLSYHHSALSRIMQERNMTRLEWNVPLWKLKLSEEEYDSLKRTLWANCHSLENYGIEAALCYAEWWRRDYMGNVPSKESVAMGLGLSRNLSEDLYLAARGALKRLRYSFIRTNHGTQYFRTLLNQGGLPINYIKSNENMSCFTAFLKGLVKELTSINYDWDNEEFYFINQLDCISYLGKTFRNENIYDVSMQIARAIITKDNSLLPYDDTDASFSELTKALQKEYSSAKNIRRARPFSLHWNLSLTGDGLGVLLVNMDSVKDVSSLSIPGLNTSTCYSFDVFVAGVFVAKYVRRSLERNDDGDVVEAKYSRITVGMGNDIVWRGEPVVEVKVRCDNDDRIFLTVSGCYPPNFDTPQVFQMLDDNSYRFGATANAEQNLAVFNWDYSDEDAKPLGICGLELYCRHFTQELLLTHKWTRETFRLTNDFTPYVAEFSGNYIPWIEDSDHKVLNKVPTIRVYDKDRQPVQKCSVLYRLRGEDNPVWRRLNSSCQLPCGLVDIRVEFPDGHTQTEKFYSVGNLTFQSMNEGVFSTEITTSCTGRLRPEVETDEGLEVVKLADNRWRLSKSRDARVCPTVCHFRIFCAGNPTLHLGIAIPFDGVTLTDVKGRTIPRGKTISMANLTNFRIVSHGRQRTNRCINVSYKSDHLPEDAPVKHLKSKVVDGIVPLSDYSDLIRRMFYLYGANTFNRSSSVVFNISGKEVYIREFVLKSTIEDGRIRVIDDTEDDTEAFECEDAVYAFPVGDNLQPDDVNAVKLERCGDDANTFAFPEDFSYDEVIVFSGPEALRRIIPKYYDRNGHDSPKEVRTLRSSNNIQHWTDLLEQASPYDGAPWKEVCKAYSICSRYRLPFATHNGLKPLADKPKLLANFVIAMWLNLSSDVLIQDIERFEQEMAVAVHWIPGSMWGECFAELSQAMNLDIVSMASVIMPQLLPILQELFSVTVSADIAPALVAYLFTGNIVPGNLLAVSDVKRYCSRIHGLADNNGDLPFVPFQLSGRYYAHTDGLRPTYRVMMESAMCAAENAAGLPGSINLFSNMNGDYARTVNFYRRYFKDIYSEIFFNTLKYIASRH